ncbi:MAG: hypothetical protein J2P27_15840, partial [Actinobacteria bacterium]|nr:hypothetical protein [Actinomycetota bacterium]
AVRARVADLTGLAVRTKVAALTTLTGLALQARLAVRATSSVRSGRGARLPVAASGPAWRLPGRRCRRALV